MTEQNTQAMSPSPMGALPFIIAHRLSTIRDSDIIVVIEDG